MAASRSLGRSPSRIAAQAAAICVMRRAEDYARRLGNSVKTLTRACLAATGQPVKQVIDTRVALEAQRPLAHTDGPVATIARRLDFTEPTNFGKFFTHLTGTSPGRFRSAHSSGCVDARRQAAVAGPARPALIGTGLGPADGSRALTWAARRSGSLTH